MKVAIIHDDLTRSGGAEQVTLCFQQAFPDAPIFTLAYNAEATYPEFRNSTIITSWFQKITKNEHVLKRFFFPLGILAMRNLKIEDYDVVIMSSTYCAKYATISARTKVICYCHQPFRLAWFPQSYAIYLEANRFKRALLDVVLSMLKRIDFHYSKRVDYFIANTSTTQEKIADCYKRNLNSISVLKPSVDCSKFYVSPLSEVKDYFLVVCRLEYYKRVDIAIALFNDLNIPLIVVGKGSEEEELKRSANSNITFLSNVSSFDLARLYSQCQALIFPQLEDYGITPLEACSSGRPVIGYGQGGILETMVPFREGSSEYTAILFEQQSKESLKKAIDVFQEQKESINVPFIRQHAEKFGKEKFIQGIKNYVERIYAS